MAGRLATLDILSNDTDANGFLVPGSVALLTSPTKGVAVVRADGRVDYTAEAGTTGQDSFTYTVQDNQGGTSNTATVSLTITPANLPPVAEPDTATTAYRTPVTIPVLANDRDPDGTLDPTSVAIASPPVTGTAVVEADGSITFTPDLATVGKVSFTYTVADDAGATSAPATVEVDVAGNLTPVPPSSGGTVFTGGGGDDLIVLGPSGGRALAGAGDDVIYGGQGRNTVAAGTGNDVVVGGPSADRLLGEGGDDILFGGRGDDTLSGGSGNDILIGGPGNDRLLGDAGIDTAIFAGSWSSFSIQRFGTTAIVRDRVGGEGRDTLNAIELLQFADGVLDLRSNSFTAGGFASPEVQALVTSPGFSTDPEPLLAAAAV